MTLIQTYYGYILKAITDFGAVWTACMDISLTHPKKTHLCTGRICQVGTKRTKMATTEDCCQSQFPFWQECVRVCVWCVCVSIYLLLKQSSVVVGPDTLASESNCPTSEPSFSPGPPPTHTHTHADTLKPEISKQMWAIQNLFGLLTW